MPVGLERAAWGMMASYNVDCDCQLVPPYKKTSISNIFISCRPPYSVFVQALHF